MSTRQSILYVFITAQFAAMLCVDSFSQNTAQRQIASNAILSSDSSLSATTDEIQALTVDDKIPDIELKNLINFPTKHGRLSNFKGKIVILDFWATWCHSCIASFAKLDSLQSKFKDQLQVLLVNSRRNGDDEKTITAFFERIKKKNGKKYMLAGITDDVLLDKLFPHKLIPHYVWISTDGIVRAITSARHLTETNIKALIQNKTLNLPKKIDMDPSKPLYLTEEVGLDDFMQYSIFLKGRVEGLGSAYKYRRSGETIRGRAMTNVPLLEMYKQLASQLMGCFDEKRMWIEVKDSSRLIYDKNKSEKDEWNNANFCSYELILPVTETGNLHKYMLEDLNRYSDFHGEIKKMKTKCLVLTRTSEIDKLHSKGNKPDFKLYRVEDPYMTNMPLARVITTLNQVQDIKLPVIDETNYAGNVDIEIKGRFDNLERVLEQLKRYDLTLVETTRDLETLVITDKVKNAVPTAKQRPGN